MMPGPNYVYKCPNCSELLIKESLLSGNTLGMKIFSDGKRINPSFYKSGFPDLTKCKKCDTIFWLSKLENIGSYLWGNTENLDWKNADVAKFLMIEDYFKAIKTGVAENEEEELIIRKEIWLAYNDKMRNAEPMFKDDSDELLWIDNLKKLKKLLDQSDIQQLIMIAEINRNLGDFKGCLSIIESIENENFNWIKEKIINECKRKNKWVIQLN